MMDLSGLLEVDRPRIDKRLYKAFRWHIRDQIATFFARNALLGANLDGLEVHHAPPNTFAALTAHFTEVAERSGLSLQVGYPGQLVDPETIAAWKQYHAEHAKLVIVDQNEHRQLHLDASEGK